MTSGSPDNLIFIGKVLRPHGLEGLLRVQSFSGSADALLNAKEIFFKSSNGVFSPFTVESVKPHKNIFLVKLTGVDDMDRGETLRNAEVYIKKEELVREEDEYFWFELLGLRVSLENGEFLGVISRIMPTGSGEIYVVKGHEREFLIPAARAVVKEIDLENGTMIVSPVEGLLELNEV